MKRNAKIFLIFLFAFCNFFGVILAKDTKQIKIGIVSDQPLDASEWLINLRNGLIEYEKENPNINIKMVEATDPQLYEPIIRTFAQSGYNIIITTYAGIVDATLRVARDFPNILFGSLYGMIENIEKYENVAEFGLDRVQTAFLAGAAAALASEKGIVGIVGGMDEPDINSIIAGWQQGLLYINPQIVDYVSYAGTWTDPTIGKERGLSLVAKGCDVIAAAAGGTGAGTAQAAAETNTKYVAWDVYYPEIFGGKNLQIGSVLNYFDVMFIKFIEKAVAGEVKGGTKMVFGLDSGACTFDIPENSPLSKEDREIIANIRTKLENGEIELTNKPLHK